MKNLFICGTPLQSLLISRIIEINKFRKSDCSLFFYTSVDNEKYRFYFKKLKAYCAKSTYYLSDNRYPSHVVRAKKIISDLNYDAIYLAAVTSSFVFIALSLKKHKYIYTFDDGTANISPSSSYAAKYGLSIRKYAGLKVLGNTYTIERIRAESSAHYTIYPGIKNNISDNLVPLSLFDAKHRNVTKQSCSVILGTVFKEAFSEPYVSSVLEKLARFSSTLANETFYLPHPRSTQVEIGVCTTIDSPLVAEDVISEMLCDYEEVKLYGFCSTSQINLAHLVGVSNFYLSVTGENPHHHQMIGVAESVGLRPKQLIDLDTYEKP